MWIRIQYKIRILPPNLQLFTPFEEFMKNFFRPLLFVATLLTAFALVGCTKDQTDPGSDYDPSTDPGLYSVKDAYNEITTYGGEINVTFVSLGAWSAKSDSEWCTLNVESGENGNGSITLKITPYGDLTDGAERTATVSISIEGYGSDLELCQIRQAVDVESGFTSGADANVWISEHLSRNYLWNDEFIKVRPLLNYWSPTDTFFNNALKTMQNIDEDGKNYASGERYFYSSLSTYMYTTGAGAPATKAFTTKNDYGITMVYPVGSTTAGEYYFLIASIVEDSPADKAGLRRGMYITKCDKGVINNNNLETYYNALMGYTADPGAVMLSISEYKQVLGGNYELAEVGEFKVDPFTYTSNPVIFEGVYQMEDYNKTIGYLVYSEFDMGADDYLVEVFAKLKKHNPTDLILDLRYNGGGDVYASAVMATGIVGEKYKGQVYGEMKFNDYRTALGEKEYFYIGQDPSMVEYPPITDALTASLNLERVYVIVTGFTASASELVINGLRGLGVEVFLIGETTEGKNVGMEVVYSSDKQFSDYDFGQYLYEFAPITFYNLNAQGFCDFSAGFEVDHKFKETDYIIFDWGKGDYCVDVALNHICTGSWSVESSVAPASRAAAQALPVVENTSLRPQGKGSRVYGAETLR